jgi:type IX secretion system PorP/SprF family membrane protein
LSIYICCGFEGKTQDTQFSQFYANPLYLAPSFAGSSELGTRVAVSYRNQWPAVKQAYNSTNVSFDHYFSKIRSGTGLYYMRDMAGSANYGISTLGFQYSFDFRITHFWHIRPGASFQYVYSSLDRNKLLYYQEVYNESILNNPIKSNFPNPFESNQDFDFSASVISYSRNYWVGLNVDHFLKPDLTFYGENYIANMPLTQALKYSLFGGVKLRLRGTLIKYFDESLTFAFNYKQQHTYKQLDLGSYYHKNPLVVGLWYRGIPLLKGKPNDAAKGNPGHDALVFLVGYKLNYLSIGYSFDFTLSQLQIVAGGAHEISLVYNFKIIERRKKPEALPCPDI